MRENLRKVYFRPADSARFDVLNACKSQSVGDGPRLDTIVSFPQMNPITQEISESLEETDVVTLRFPDHLKRPGMDTLRFFENSSPNPNSIVCENPNTDPILIPGGTLITGGWQNRYFPNSRTVKSGSSELSVLCAERGRFVGEAEFSGVSLLPAFLRNRFAQPRDQLAFWNDIMESLTLSNSPSQTLSPIDFESDTIQLAEIPADFFGGYSLHDSAGLSSFRFDSSASPSQVKRDLGVEIQYWKRLKKNARNARDYFRIFDEKMRVGIRCTADGRPIKDLDGKFFVFRYEPDDLKTGFTPPLESAPEPDKLEFSKTDHFQSSSEWLDSAKSARLSQTGTSGDIRFYSVSHSDFNLTGQVVTSKDEPVLIDITSFRANAET